MKLFFMALASVAMLANQSPANAQAFGLQMGQKHGELNVKEDGGGMLYFIIPPIPHPDFESYLALITPKGGLCRVTGIGKMLPNDPVGMAVKIRFKSLESSLSSKYGSSKRSDFLKSDSIFRKEQEWVMGIFKQERYLFTVWDSEQKSNLPRNLDSINLQVQAADHAASFVNVSYQFSNFDLCLKEIRAVSNRAL